MTPFGFHPLSAERWDDFESLFGPRGACAGCWCMYWRQTGKEFESQKGEANKGHMRKLVEAGLEPGILAYAGEDPIGWCALAPRGEWTRLDRSRILKPVDDRAVWSVVCFFIKKPYRGQGLTAQLLRAAVEYAGKRGARIVEGYPVEPQKVTAPVFVYTGIASAFLAAGFHEVARRSPTRPIMRYHLKES